jgi:uncharacterized alkaline shock family protein YloU
VDGVRELVDGHRRHRGVRVNDQEGAHSVEIQIALDWGGLAPDVGATVQQRVAEYLRRMAKLPSVAVDVVIVGVAPPTT